MTCSGCKSLKSLTFGENFSTNSVTATAGVKNYKNMFAGCNSLRYIDFYTSNHTAAITSVNKNSEGNMFYGVPETTVIYLPYRSNNVTNVTNVVYSHDVTGGGGHGGGTQESNYELKCPKYFSMDKVDIELPRDFIANVAEYKRTMNNSFGSVILPYAFTTNDEIQAYTLDEEHKEKMYFRGAETVAAHTPFAFKKFTENTTTADFTISAVSSLIKATHTTSANEYQKDATHATGYFKYNNNEYVKGAPYTANTNLSGWTSKGYYVNETVDDYSGTFYIASDRFYKADGALTMFPHRVTFHGAWTLSGNNNAKSYAIGTGSDLIETAIEAADLRKMEREADAIYDMQGRKISALQRGINIVRMSDGTVRKVISDK